MAGSLYISPTKPLLLTVEDNKLNMWRLYD